QEQILLRLGSAVQRLDSLGAIATRVATEIDTALHVQSVTVLFRDAHDRRRFFDPLSQRVLMEPRLPHGAAPLEVGGRHARRLFAQLAGSGAERAWLAELGAELAVPITGLDHAPV